MGNVDRLIRRKMNIWIQLMCIAAVGLVVCCTFFLTISKEDDTDDGMDTRLQFADVVQYAEEENYDSLKEYDCFITNLNGEVIFSNTNEYEQGDYINLHALSSENGQIKASEQKAQFVTPLMKEQKQSGMLIINYIKSSPSVPQRTYLLLIVPILLGIFLFVGGIQLKKIMKKRVLAPTGEMSELCDNLLKGNYNNKISYYQKDEIGLLARKLELVQEEFKSSIEHAQMLDENEKMLLACVSHDLKTPISTIIGCAEGMKSGLISDREGMERYSETILAKANLLTRMINDILDFTSAKMDSLPLQRKEIYAQEFIEGTLKQLQPDVKRCGLELTWNEIPNVLINIAPNRIYQVFQNIISNSMKYMNQGGVIQVVCSEWELNLLVEIKDNGQGIAAADIPYIFERFYRGEKARTQKETTGSGLGLSIVKNIVERHGGKVECESELTKGTTIRFLLPMV